MTKAIYMAYGANLNIRNMQMRCPAAEPIGAIMLPDFRLVFKGVADIIEAPGLEVPIGYWEITPECEASLDRFEGYRAEAPSEGLYRKRYWKKAGSKTRYMAYVMNLSHFGPPQQSYFDSIAEGYDDFDFSYDRLNEALQHSYDNRMPDPYVSRKWG